jgi:Sugar phosphate isomerases/epimerases
MKISLHPARLNAGALSLAEFADLAARNDFAAFEFSIGGARKLIEEKGGPEAVKTFLAEKNVELGSFGLSVEWRGDEETFQKGLAALEDEAAVAASLGADRCTTWMPPAVNDDAEAWIARTADRFREIARIFGRHGVRLGLEWVGPHHLRAGAPNAMGANAAIYTLPGTLDLIARIGEPNVGLLVDSYHCYTTGVTGDDLAKLTDAQIVHVHINDAPKGSGPEGARDGERVLPGEGEIDLKDFLDGLRRAGYRGYIAPEILNPNNIADDPETAAAKVRMSLRTVGL